MLVKIQINTTETKLLHTSVLNLLLNPHFQALHSMPYLFSDSLDLVNIPSRYSQKVLTEVCSSHIPRIQHSQAEHSCSHAQGFSTSDVGGFTVLGTRSPELNKRRLHCIKLQAKEFSRELRCYFASCRSTAIEVAEGRTE